MDSKAFKFLLFGGVFSFLLALISLDWYVFWYSPTSPSQQVMTPFTIHKGDSIRKIGYALEDTRLFSRPFYLKTYLRYQRWFHYFKYGDYILNPHDTPADIVLQLVEGKVQMHNLTIVPGTSWEQLKEKIQQSSLIKEDLLTTSDIEAFCYKNRIPSIEGWLAPDTYTISRDTKESDFLALAIARQHQILQSIHQENQCPLDIYDTVTMASIIEKESSLPSEYPFISSTYHNRLQIQMRLQSDPTVLYGRPKERTGPLTYKDLRYNHSHNTYVNHGLPPTPIAYPSKDAMITACVPAQSEYLYFVASTQQAGHIFSKTYKEHQHVRNSQAAHSKT